MPKNSFVLKMLKVKVLVLVFAIFGSACATLGSDLEDDDFRMLKESEDEDGNLEIQNDLDEGVEVQNDLEDGSKTFYSGNGTLNLSI